MWKVSISIRDTWVRQETFTGEKSAPEASDRYQHYRIERRSYNQGDAFAPDVYRSFTAPFRMSVSRPSRPLPLMPGRPSLATISMPLVCDISWIRTRIIAERFILFLFIRASCLCFKICTRTEYTLQINISHLIVIYVSLYLSEIQIFIYYSFYRNYINLNRAINFTLNMWYICAYTLLFKL